MAQLLIRNLDEDVKRRLQGRAKRRGRSTEEEVRQILQAASRERDAPEEPLGTRIARRFAALGLRDDEDIPELRGQPPRPAVFDE
jgi:plasmid stability protein